MPADCPMNIFGFRAPFSTLSSLHIIIIILFIIARQQMIAERFLSGSLARPSSFLLHFID